MGSLDISKTSNSQFCFIWAISNNNISPSPLDPKKIKMMPVETPPQLPAASKYK